MRREDIIQPLFYASISSISFTIMLTCTRNHTLSHTHTCIGVCVREKMCRCGFTPKNHVAQNANDQNIARGYIDTEKPISYAVIQIFGMPNQNATHHISVEIVVVFSIPQS